MSSTKVLKIHYEHRTEHTEFVHLKHWTQHLIKPKQLPFLYLTLMSLGGQQED